MNNTIMDKKRQGHVESITMRMLDILCDEMSMSPISAAYAFMQISTKFLCQFDHEAVAEILQSAAEHAQKEISGDEHAGRCAAPFDRICAAFDRAEQPLN